MLGVHCQDWFDRHAYGGERLTITRATVRLDLREVENYRSPLASHVCDSGRTCTNQVRSCMFEKNFELQDTPVRPRCDSLFLCRDPAHGSHSLPCALREPWTASC